MIGLEIPQDNSFKTPGKKKRVTKAPVNDTLVTGNMSLGMNCFLKRKANVFLKRKAQLISGGNMIELIKKETLCRVVYINNFRMGFLIGELNNLKATGTYFGDSYLHILTNKDIFAMKKFGKSIPVDIPTEQIITLHHYPLMEELLIKSIFELN